MAQSTSSRLLDSSYVESFIAILRKLAIKEFASEKIPRHSVIRKQIESLVTSRSDIETLCSALHKDPFLALLLIFTILWCAYQNNNLYCG